MALYKASLKRYGDKYKLICFYCDPFDDRVIERSESAEHSTIGTKLENSLIRSRGKVMEYGMCNDWEYYVTLTINKEKFDRYDLKGYSKALREWIRNYNQRKMGEGQKVKYLLIPELHRDGATHMHGLLMGLPKSHLIKNQHGYLDWPAYQNKFGYISIDPLRDKDSTVKYITKYITKDLTLQSMMLHSHIYYASQGLNTAEYVCKDVLITLPEDYRFDCDGDFCGLKWFKDPSKIDFMDWDGVIFNVNS